jgi:RHS repeat-associated protein
MTRVDNAGSVVPEVTLSMAYDFDGNRTGLQDNLGGGISYAWNNQRLQSMALYTENYKSAQVGFGYDSVGRLDSLTRTANGNYTTINTSYTLDLLDRVTSITHSKGMGEDASTLSQFTYGYDASGRVTNYTGPEGSLSFALDANGQLLSVTGSRSEAYAFDANGNRTSNSTAAGNLLLNDGKYSYTYDLEGNQKTKTRISDGHMTEFFWDYRNQLTKALVKDANGVVLKELRFTYDVEGRRVGSWVDADGVGPGTADQVWTVYDGANPYMDFDGNEELQTRYLYGPGIDELFARIGAAEDPQWYLTDRLGSVRQIVDGAGTILDDIVYDSFGNVLSESNPSQGDRFKFTGREFSPDLGIYYYRARWYDPATGQFSSQDPFGFSAGDVNLYRYVGNAPGNGTDPSGLWASWWDETKGVFSYIFSNKVETIKLTAFGVGEGFNNIFIQPTYRTGQFVGDTVVIIGWDGNHEPWNPYLDAYLHNRLSYFETWLSVTLEAESTFLMGCSASKAIKNPYVQSENISNKMEIVRRLGKEGENAAGIIRNTQRIESLSGKTKYRIPDEITPTALREIKNVVRLDFNAQIQDSLHYAIMTNREMVLVVRPNTQLSQGL